MASKKKTRSTNPPQSYWRAHWSQLALAALMLLGFGLRMVDLTDAPLDFHPTRQLRDAIVAHSIYFQLHPPADSYLQDQALALRNSVAELEPPILESIVAVGYLAAGGEQLWIARVIVALFWVAAAVPLFDLARRFTGRGAALLAAAYFLFLPFAVQASRSFQPDPFMVVWLIVGMYAAYRWSESQEWKWAWVAGAASGFAILIKIVAAYIVIGYMAAAVLAALGLRAALRSRQVWAMALVSVIPALIYYFLNIGDTSGNYFQNWIVALLPLAFVPAFYVLWINMLSGLMGGSALIASALGVFIAQARARSLLLGAWAGYIVYGITLPHQTTTHSYYHIQLVPIIALSLAPLFQLLVRRVARLPRTWQLAAGLVAAATLLFAAWTVRSTLLGVDYRSEPAFWERIGTVVPRDGNTIALVQSYGHLLNYYGGRKVELWPIAAELKLAGLRGNSVEDFEEFFAERTAGMQYFMITAFNQLELQPLLKDYLAAHYPVYQEGDGYLIYDLDPSSGS
jgi:hypothetical protein